MRRTLKYRCPKTGSPVALTVDEFPPPRDEVGRPNGAQHHALVDCIGAAKCGVATAVNGNTAYDWRKCAAYEQ